LLARDASIVDLDHVALGTTFHTVAELRNQVGVGHKAVSRETVETTLPVVEVLAALAILVVHT